MVNKSLYGPDVIVVEPVASPYRFEG